MMTLRPIAKLLIVVLIGVGVITGFWWATRPRVEGNGPPLRLEDTRESDISGFARALEPRDFTFPADHGPHPEFQTEWWYYTGNLDTADGRHLGYQLTFFRRALAAGLAARPSALAANQIYFAHFAVTDVAGAAHHEFERFSRGAAGLAGASGAPFEVWLEDWRAEALDATGNVVRLTAEQAGVSLDLTLRAAKPLVAHGDRGLSPKSQAAGNASYYLSFTRMATTGRVTLPGGGDLAVTGESWFDHEWSTSALGEGAVGWDWFSLQLGDGREVMFFQIRREDGSLEPVSGGTLVEADGSPRRLAAGDVQIEVGDRWRSPESGGEYPSRWRIRIPSAQIDIAVEPWLADQELRVSSVYWEGAVRLAGSSLGRAVTGVGYIEMTGYAAPLAGEV